MVFRCSTLALNRTIIMKYRVRVFTLLVIMFIKVMRRVENYLLFVQNEEKNGIMLIVLAEKSELVC